MKIIKLQAENVKKLRAVGIHIEDGMVKSAVAPATAAPPGTPRPPRQPSPAAPAPSDKRPAPVSPISTPRPK